MTRLYLPLPGLPERLEISVANSFWRRLKGLLGTRRLDRDKGLLLRRCNSVHMLGMRYPLDIVYLDQGGVIVKLVENLRPWQVSACRQARDTLEVAAGTISRANWRLGERLEWQSPPGLCSKSGQ
ncbi:MAG: DUF192 domain-containing protein [Sporomusaceae bacterium]|nr:DUF192 domain-containing protein [Sporomusaceae bacterium]